MREIKCIDDLEKYTSCPYCQTAYAYTQKDVAHDVFELLSRSKPKDLVFCPKCQTLFEV